MFIQLDHEEETKRNEKKLVELTHEFEKLNQSIESLFEEAELSEEGISHFCSTKENFSESAWARLQEEHEKLNLKLEKQLSQVKNPSATKKRYDERNVAPHWIFVR